jgi:hypothetical protein
LTNIPVIEDGPGDRRVPPEAPDDLRLESDRRLAISTVAILVCLNLAFVTLQLSAGRVRISNIPPVIMVRLVGAVVAALLMGVLFNARTQRALEYVVFAGSFVAAALVLLVQALSPASDVPAIAFDPVFVTALFVALPSRPLLQAIPAAALSIGAGVTLFRPGSGIGDADRLQFAIVFVAALSLGYVASIRRNQLRRDLIESRNAERNAFVEVQRAKSELQSLHGIIPICSHCQRVRIEDGQLWERVDMYVSKRTDAAFSHGVCPDCLAEHYPNVRAR